MDFRLFSSLPAMLFASAARVPDRPGLWARGKDGWRAMSYAEVAAAVRVLARGLAALGIKPGDRVAVVAENRPEWLIADYAIMSAGAVGVPAYTTNTVADHRHILSNSGAVAAIISTQALAEKVLAAAQGSDCRLVIAMEAAPGTLAWNEAMARGRDAPDMVDATVARLGRRDLATIIHTSGTGGVPKGVMLHHGAMLANAHGAYRLLRSYGLEHEIYMSFLPLSHSYEHTCCGTLALGIGAEIHFVESAENLMKLLPEVRPTLMTAVPRLYEVMHQRIQTQLAKDGGLRAKLFHLAVAIGRRRYDGCLSITDRLVDPLVDKLVRDKVRARFGGRLKALVSGGAPLNPELGLFFTALGMTLLQGYGQTESAPVIAANPPERPKLDTVGPPLEGVEVRIAEDGEILARGEMVMLGYWNDPAATAATVREGWLHTGDIGLIDADGYLKITDRKKDFIKNAGGDMIAPSKVEGELLLEPEIAQAMVFGDRRPHLVAILVPHADAIAAFAKAKGVAPDLAALSTDKEFQAVMERALARANKRLQGAERVRRFIVAREPFSVANQMMTPTMKVRRHKVREIYGPELEELYG